jgi:hypothetical protein
MVSGEIGRGGRTVTAPEWVLIATCVFGNTLFICKYAPDYLTDHWLLPAAYAVCVSAATWLAMREPKRWGGVLFTLPRWLKRRMAGTGAIALAAAGLVALMLQFDPARIAVGRHLALHEWLTRLLDGEFPYAALSNPSGLPFLFVLALPFYLLGDLGLLQVAGFLLFAYLMRGSDLPTGRWYLTLLLLVTSPMFLWEVVTRSDLFTNMVVVLLTLWLLRARAGGVTAFGAAALGATAGLVLSTRLVVCLIYLIWSGSVLGWRRRNVWTFVPALALGFTLTLLPFMIWNMEYFVEYGPFAIQSTYAPFGLIAAAVLVGVFCARRTRSTAGLLTASALVLFGVVAVAFILSVTRFGLDAALYAERFDISYFVLPLPFALAALQSRGPADAGESAPLQAKG